MKKALCLLILVFVVMVPVYAQIPGCVIRTDWGIYTVVRGDTVNRIALRYNTTARALAAGNCLINPNQIRVGQQLRVPPTGNTVPSTGSRSIGATFQQFERGFMTWRVDTGEIVVYYTSGTSTSGIVTAYSSSSYAALPDNPVTETPPTARLRPVFGFGKVWGNFSAVRSNLGWATGSEQGYLMNVAPDAAGYRFSLPNGSVITNNANRTWLLNSGSIPSAPGGGTPTGGNPNPATITTLASMQIFEYGFMTWRSNTGEIVVYVNTGTNAGTVIAYPTASYAYMPENPVTETAPAGRVRPILGFGKIWGNVPNVRTSLGWATTAEQSYSMIVTTANNAYNFTLPNGSVLQNTDNQTWSLISGSGVPSVPRPPSSGTRYMVGNVVIAPYITSGNAGYQLLNNQTITLRWAEVPTGSSIVNFILTRPNGTNSVIATDTNLADGASATWTVEPGVTGTISASSVTTANNANGNSYGVSIVAVTVPATTVYAAYQPFEQGAMLWRQDDESITVLYNNGTVTFYAVGGYGTLADNPITDTPPTGRVRPINGFGRIWGNYADVRTALGWATAAEQGFNLTTRIMPTNLGGQPCFNTPDGRNIQLSMASPGVASWQTVSSCG